MDELLEKYKGPDKLRDFAWSPLMENPHVVKWYNHSFRWRMDTYVLVTSICPLRAYVYDRALVRIDEMAYSLCERPACIIWSLSELKEYLSVHEPEVSFVNLMQRVHKAIGLTLLSVEPIFFEKYEKFKPGFRCRRCHHLLRFEISFDSSLDPKGKFTSRS